MPSYIDPEIKEIFKYYDQQVGRPLFNTPLSFVRLNKWPLDSYSLFRNLDEAWNYVGNPDNPSYPGQVISTYNIDGSTGTALPNSKADGKYRLYVVTKDTTKPNGLGLREFVGSEDAWRLINFIPNYNNGTESSTKILNSDTSSGPLTFAPGNDNISLSWNATDLKNILRISSSDFKVETKKEGSTKFWITGVRQVLDSSITTNVFDASIYVTEKVGEMVVPTMNSSVNNVSDANITNASITNEVVLNSSIENLKVHNSSLGNAYIESIKAKDLNVSTAIIGTETVQNSTIENATITTEKVQNSSITNSNIVNASIDSGYIKEEHVLKSIVDNASISNASIQNGTIQAGVLIDASIHDAEVNNININNSSTKNSSVINFYTEKETILNSSVRDQFVQNSTVINSSIKNLYSTNATIDYIEALDISIGGFSLKDIAEQGPTYNISIIAGYQNPFTEAPRIVIDNPTESLDEKYWFKSLKYDSASLSWSDIPNSNVPCVKGTYTYSSKGIVEYLNIYTVYQTENLECTKTINLDDASAWYGDIVQTLWPIFEFNDANKISYKNLTAGIALYNDKGRCSNIIALRYTPKCTGMLEDFSYGHKIEITIF
jgi:hypothetical protein